MSNQDRPVGHTNEQDRKTSGPRSEKKYINHESEEINSDHSVDSDEYEFVHEEFEIEHEDGTLGRERLPTETFHGTWSGAFSDGVKAAGEITKASKSYYNAVANSGVTRAGWSIGSAFASTANRGALSVASFAVGATGTSEDRLPRKFQGWLQTKKEMEAHNQRVLEARKRHKEAKVINKLVEKGEVILPPGSKYGPTQCPVRLPPRASHQVEDPYIGSPDRLSDVSVDRLWKMNDERNLPVRGTPPSRRRHTDTMKYPNTGADAEENGGEGRELAGDIPPQYDVFRSGIQDDTTHLEDSTMRPFKTPAHATGVFKDLETPDTVRRQLNEPFNVATPSNVDSPYLSYHEQQGLHGLGGFDSIPDLSPSKTKSTGNGRRDSFHRHRKALSTGSLSRTVANDDFVDTPLYGTSPQDARVDAADHDNDEAKDYPPPLPLKGATDSLKPPEKFKAKLVDKVEDADDEEDAMGLGGMFDD